MTPLPDGAACFSSVYAGGDISDCLKTAGDNGEIGYCPSCPYYHRNGMSFFSDGDRYRRDIEDDCKALSEAVSLVRKEKGSVEDIGDIMLRLKASSKSYEAYLMAKYQEKEAANGKD